MARIRTIKPEFWTDEKVVRLPFQTRLLFIGIWNFCDDHGCIDDSPDRIRLQILPADSGVDIEAELDLLVAADLLEILISETGERAFRVKNWDKHQKVDNPSKVRVCGPDYKKLAIPNESRRLLAKKYGCAPGEAHDAECYFCGSPGAVYWHRLSSGRPSAWVSFSGLEIDHLVPEAKGGSGLSENLILSCRSCNRGRRDNDFIQFLYRGSSRVDEQSQVIVSPIEDPRDIPETSPSHRDTSPALASPIEGSPLEGKGKGKGLKMHTSLTAVVVRGDPRTPAAAGEDEDPNPRDGPDVVPYDDIVALYHAALPTLPRVRELTAKRRRSIRARWVSGALPDLDAWREFFAYIARSPFLRGEGPQRQETGRPFVPDLQWLVAEANYVRISEGRYHDKAAGGGRAARAVG